MENPEPAQEAYDLARERIAAAKEGGERVLCLSPITVQFDGTTYSGDERFRHLTELPPGIAEMTALESLHLVATQVADIVPLEGLATLQWLDIQDTQVADIAPLAGLAALQTLGLAGTQVADIAPLAGLANLNDLNFSNIPACADDPKLAELSEITDNEDRTRRTLAYLRGEESIDEPELDEGSTAKAVADDGELADPTPDQVRNVQQRLAEAGFDPGPADGIFGDKSQQAMLTALEKANLKDSGYLLRDFNQLNYFLDELIMLKSEPAPPPDETAPFYSDQPATQDLLNRRAVAETLGTIVDEVWNERRAAEKKPEPGAGRAEHDRTFIVHLHGRWGSGKTSILNFLREVLLSGEIAKPEPKDRHLDRAPDPPWVIVDYNAWRNQSLGPAWWSLMDTVYREAAAQLGGWSKDDGPRVLFRHYLWRFRARWLEYVGVLAVAVAVVFAVFQLDLGEGWLDKATNTGTVVAVFVGVITLLNRLSIGTARTAKQYMELTRDPMTPLIGRYSALIEDIGRPVAVFIDDLDRCDAKFVVELLQSVQTMFRSAPVLYVVAADRGWICTSYEQVYQPYCEPIAEPGHSLGHMFLEKIFQLSIEVPSLAGAQRKAFWDHLLQTKDKVTPEDREAIDAEVTDRLKDAKTEQAVVRIVDEEAKRSPERGAIAGARAFQHMQSRELVGEREHFLAGYADLLEANPRAMKRLLNAYGFRRGFDIQSPDRSDPDALVRWTILENRWPMLASHLARRSAGDSDRKIMAALMNDPEVERVKGTLTWEKLRTIAGAPSQPRN